VPPPSFFPTQGNLSSPPPPSSFTSVGDAFFALVFTFV
jgi:hypothetical protein